MRILFLLICFFSYNLLSAQGWDWGIDVAQKKGLPRIFNHQVDSFGNSYLTTNGNGSNDMVLKSTNGDSASYIKYVRKLIKLNRKGKKIWDKSLPPGNFIFLLNRENELYIILEQTRSYSDFKFANKTTKNPISPSLLNKYYLLKYDKNGNEKDLIELFTFLIAFHFWIGII